MLNHKIICGKSEIELKQFDDNTFDSCVTDPPYGLEFMGKDWDKFPLRDRGQRLTGNGNPTHAKGFGRNVAYGASKESLVVFQQFTYEWATELYRVMKPGAHILIFGGTRTYHRMACAIEDAEFEVRDMLEWFYGSGFPKSLDISKQLDKMKGKEREVIGTKQGHEEFANRGNLSSVRSLKGTLGSKGGFSRPWMDDPEKVERYHQLTAPTSKESIQWNGWGTAMKPAHEPILLARKPISERNIASNVLKWGVGGLNVESCRVGLNGGTKSKGKGVESEICYGNGLNKTGVDPINKGRFPANLILDEEAGMMLDEQSGPSKSVMEDGANRRAYQEYKITNPSGWKEVNRQRKTEGFNDNGGASRFFYQAKASQKDRWYYCTICKQAYPMKERDKHIHNAPEKEQYKYLEFHPTQKPEALISYLARLVTPPKGTMLDPFLGSGTGLIAAEQEGFNCLGIDSKREYCLISHQRLKSEIEQVQATLTNEKSQITRTGF